MTPTTNFRFPAWILNSTPTSTPTFTPVLHLALASLLVLTLTALWGCGNKYGTELKYGNGRLFYTPAVTETDAKKLGDYLNGLRFFDGAEKSAQIDKQGEKYEFRFPVKKEFENDEAFLANSKQTCKELSAQVFGGAPVEVHLCDNKLKTLRVVTAD